MRAERIDKGVKRGPRPPGWINPAKGRPLLAKREPLHIRFWRKVEKSGPDECWNWKGTLRKGYGSIWGGDGSTPSAHRVSWELHGNPLPELPYVLDHACKNKRCVNPAHLRVVLQEENCTVLARPTPHYANKLKTHCSACGNPLSGENLAVVRSMRRGRMSDARQCLTCYPNLWRHAVVPRPRPPGSKWKKSDPDYHLRPWANREQSPKDSSNG